MNATVCTIKSFCHEKASYVIYHEIYVVTIAASLFGRTNLLYISNGETNDILL